MKGFIQEVERKLSYPKGVVEEIMEWVLVRRDAHLPISYKLIIAKAKLLIRPHNPQFKLQKAGWNSFAPPFPFHAFQNIHLTETAHSAGM